MQEYYLYDERNYFLEKVETDSAPENSTVVAPPEEPWTNVWPYWNGESWDLHRDDLGRYIYNEFIPVGLPYHSHGMISSEYSFNPVVPILLKDYKNQRLSQCTESLKNKTDSNLACFFSPLLKERINCCSQSIINISILLKKITEMDPKPVTIPFRLFNNTFKNIPPDSLSLVLDELHAYRCSCFNKKWFYWNKIKNATKREDLDNFVFDYSY